MKFTLQPLLWKYTHICISFFPLYHYFFLSSQRATDCHLSVKGIRHVLQMSSDCLYRYVCVLSFSFSTYDNQDTNVITQAVTTSVSAVVAQLPWYCSTSFPLRVGSSEITKLLLNQSRKEKFINLRWLLIKDQT